MHDSHFLYHHAATPARSCYKRMRIYARCQDFVKEIKFRSLGEGRRGAKNKRNPHSPLAAEQAAGFVQQLFVLITRTSATSR